MNFIQNIRLNAGSYLLRNKHLIARSRAMMNVYSAKTIGILYSADSPENIKLVKKYCDILREGGKDVYTLGFMNEKELPGGKNVLEREHFFSRHEINWYFKPSSGITSDFEKKEFDLLFDFGISWRLPLTFISSQSKAKCKVGRYSDEYSTIYDVMIETNEKQGLEYLVRNAYEYMSLINKRAS